ncbi:AAA family ATPase [Enterococcus xiangfangensis]|uniref:AAA family ATPase n=1 Tax=Enterococcus xiangfangensis TaxID=1296537 RepID=A0ABU3F887_9ENTE|nr:AAA family ATPase [Enterococcus xiangfangensis]MDT2758879.1 AAA family ATPase [Enterococcus xiangfangensis]
MTKGRIVIITGTPATGKSTVSAYLSTHSDQEKSVHMHTDDFYHLIKKGSIAPHLAAADTQNGVVIAAFLAATKVFAENGYEVIVDGIIGPWFLTPWITAAADHDIHYIILRASKEETLARGIQREKRTAQTTTELIEVMWDQFNQLGAFESHVIDTTTQSVEQSVAKIKSHLQDRSLLLSASEPK